MRNWERRLNKNPKKLIRMSKTFSDHTKWHNMKYKYVVKVPRNVKDAINFDYDNVNTLWKYSITK